jgi:3-hydroxyacyl-[acyl-carrier-protein] dehydratase
MAKIPNLQNHSMPNSSSNDLETHRPVLSPARVFTGKDDRSLREALRHCSASTYEAVRQFRRTANPVHLPAIILGVIERYVEPTLRTKLKSPDDGLRLAEDLGIDSLTMMEIVVLVEEVLQISIKHEDLCHLRTLGNVREFIERKVRGLPPPVPARSMAGGLVME